MIWVLSEPLESVYLQAEEEGVFIRSDIYSFDIDKLPPAKPLNELGQKLFSVIPILLEQGYAELIGESIKIPYDQFVSLDDLDISTFDEIVQWCPFFIELSTSGSLGHKDFRYRIKYFSGRHQISPERLGCFIKHLNTIYRLDRQTYSLVEQIERFRLLTPEEKASPESLIYFASIRGLAEGVGAQIDQYIKCNKVLIPPTLGVDLIEEHDGRISFAPYLDGVPREELRRVFLQSADPSDLFVDDGSGGRIRLVFTPEQREALQRMAKVRHLGGKEKTEVLRNPQALFDGVAAAVDLEIGDYGPRVRGIGSFPFVSQPVIQRSNTGIFDDPELPSYPFDSKKPRLNAGIECTYPDGSKETVFFQSLDELVQFNHKVQSAYRGGTGIVQLDDRSLVVDKDFSRGVADLVSRLTPPAQRCKTDDGDRKYLLIYENDEQLEYEENWMWHRVDHTSLTLPKCLKDDVALKPHQEEGLRWLQINFLLEGKKGCLLADDMGLGKTLQVLAFIAWLIEREELTAEGNLNPEAAPWKPVLIITPVMLLENETWIYDMKKFFKNDGAIFRPWCILHGQRLKDMRIAGSDGQETAVQRPLLDLQRLCQYRVILTNYETIVNYQFSFASMKSNWTLVVTDEAQAQKTPKTKISHALKSLAPRFRIACTGTPVETRLLDVWNILDYLQPGEILGSALDFSKNYEQPLNDRPEQMDAILKSLRTRLHFGKPSAFILRREKSQALIGLPKKYEHKIFCELSSQQRELHIDFIARARQGGEGNHPLALIQGLMRLYQHPLLIPRYDPSKIVGLKGLIELCPKLAKLLDVLDEIRKHGEKALIFTRSIEMQQLLAASIFEFFRQRVDIINGAANRHETVTSANTRKAIINRFRTDSNLNFIILSPEVAGVGLTLVEANHVVHYGRWWNPAKESQATDRAYRIGQERDVHVYYLIAKDPHGKFISFDEKLDELITRRRKMAMDFLAPMPGEQDLQNELYREIVGDSIPSDGVTTPIRIDDVRALPWDRFEALIAVLEKKEGRRVILTPHSGDMGIDVISIHGNHARLIQCKHRRYGDELEPETVAEVVNAFDTYRARIFCGTRYTLKPALVTNGRISPYMLDLCTQHDIEVVWGPHFAELLQRSSCTLAELENMEASRLESVNQIRTLLPQSF